MKKTKLLLPIISVASVATIVTPIITSCASGTKFDAFQDIDTRNWEMCSDSSLTTDEAIKRYSKAIEKNPSILMNDYIYGRHIMAKKVGTRLNINKVNHPEYQPLVPSVITTTHNEHYEDFQNNIYSQMFLQEKSFEISCPKLTINDVNAVTCMDLVSSCKAIFNLDMSDLPFVPGNYYYGLGSAVAEWVLFSQFNVEYEISIDINVKDAPVFIATAETSHAFNIPNPEITPIPTTSVGCCGLLYLMKGDKLDEEKISKDIDIYLKMSRSINFYDKKTKKLVMSVESLTGDTDAKFDIEVHINYDTLMSELTRINSYTKTSYNMEMMATLLQWPSYYFSNTSVKDGSAE